MMRLKTILMLCCGLSLLFSSVGKAEDICVIRGLDFSIYEDVLTGFWKDLGQSPSPCNEVLEGKESQVKKKLGEEKPKLILALGNSSISFIQKNFPDTPMVFGMATDPGSKYKGVITDIPFEDQLKLVKKVLPSLRRIGLIYSVANQTMASQFQTAAQGEGININAHAVNGPDESTQVVQNFTEEDLLWILPDQGVVTSKNRSALFKLAREKGLKIYAFSPIYLKGSDGADLSVSLDWKEHGSQIAELVKKMLSKPNGNYPIEKPKKVKIYIKKDRQGFNLDQSNLEFVP